MSSIAISVNNIKSKDLILEKYIKEVNIIKPLGREEEFLLANEFILTGDIAVANQLIKSQLRSVVRIAFNYKNYGISMMDMIAEGNLGLMHAVKKFHPDMGYRLSTYATWWIKAYITDFILRSWSIVKIGTTKLQKRLFFNLSKIKRRLGFAYNSALNGENIKLAAEYSGLSDREFTEMDIRITSPDISLNKASEDNLEFGDTIPSDLQNPEQVLMKNDEKKRRMIMVKNALTQLNEREKEIFYQRYIVEPKATLHDLSQKFGISKERIRQIEERCLEKIKLYIGS
ncbi:unnamed protein product [Rotaria magnacalcarata]|uniref:RNA polymerase sigma-70 domain-containing protein n=1 Tax=Rotaria magnacalcarata TaxID=392030 RepID=A0A816FI08_9BILA|nr:unnamed protein product [Rotaria magnacalcarata]CAF3788642.1 unnamed protein product [Rotaria magnacalcarata]